MTDRVREVLRAAVEKHCHCDTRWPATARIDDTHMADFISDLRAALASEPGVSEKCPGCGGLGIDRTDNSKCSYGCNGSGRLSRQQPAAEAGASTPQPANLKAMRDERGGTIDELIIAAMDVLHHDRSEGSEVDQYECSTLREKFGAILNPAPSPAAHGNQGEHVEALKPPPPHRRRRDR